MSQQYDEELQGAGSTDAGEQAAVDPSTDASTDLPADLPTDEEVAGTEEDADRRPPRRSPRTAEAARARRTPPRRTTPPPTPLEEFREALRAKIGDWFVVHTYSGMENRVKANLENRITSLNMEDYIHEVIVPTEEVAEIKNGQRKLVSRTVLPGYVLVRMDLTDESWAAVRHTPSVTGFVGHSHQPVPLSLDEVESMLAPAVAGRGRGGRAPSRAAAAAAPPRRRSRSPTSTCPTRSWWSTVRSPRCTRRSPRSTPSRRGSRPSSRSSAGRPRSS